MQALHAGFTLMLPTGPVDSVVLVLHGGKSASTAPSRPWHLSSLRMRPITSALAARGRSRGVAVAQLRYRERGWNGNRESPVADARWAIEQLTDHFGQLPIVLVGHSMGGRAAAHLSQEPGVIGVLALAPWWPENEGSLFGKGQRLLVLHGRSDRWTDPASSARQVQAAKARGVAASWRTMPGGHFMLRNPGRWHRIAAETAISWLHPSQIAIAPNER